MKLSLRTISALAPSFLILLTAGVTEACSDWELKSHQFGIREEGKGIAKRCGSKSENSLSRRQDGSLTGVTSSSTAANYSCPDTCQMPNCRCASTSPPGGLSPSETPMFLVFTADDAVQSYTTKAVDSILAHRVNPNGCSPKMTYYVSLSYTNYSAITEWFVKGNEIADHSMTHPEVPSAAEINGNLIAQNTLAGIPLSEIIGFRAPYLNYTPELLQNLQTSGFTYDSSASSSIPANQTGTDAYWPYTLDYGLANDCLSFEGICSGLPKIPGLWEFPLYATFGTGGPNDIHLMDPWLDDSPDVVLAFMKETFMTHYNGNRQPFGVYTHPIHLATGYPGVTDPIAQINMLNEFMDWAQNISDVWIVSNKQLLEWMKDPVPISNLGASDALKCQVPNLPNNTQICNGMIPQENGLLEECFFSDFPFYTCYGCPTTPPTTDVPNPQQSSVKGAPLRYRLPSNCSTYWWDPIKGQCLCTGSDCSFNDVSRAIGPNGQNLSSAGGTGTTSTSAAAASSTGPTFVPFNAAGSRFGMVPIWTLLLGMVIGGALTLWA